MPFRIFWDPHPAGDTKKIICRGPGGVLVVHGKMLLFRNFSGPDQQQINTNDTCVQGGGSVAEARLATGG